MATGYYGASASRSAGADPAVEAWYRERYGMTTSPYAGVESQARQAQSQMERSIRRSVAGSESASPFAAQREAAGAIADASPELAERQYAAMQGVTNSLRPVMEAEIQRRQQRADQIMGAGLSAGGAMLGSLTQGFGAQGGGGAGGGGGGLGSLLGPLGGMLGGGGGQPQAQAAQPQAVPQTAAVFGDERLAPRGAAMAPEAVARQQAGGAAGIAGYQQAPQAAMPVQAQAQQAIQQPQPQAAGGSPLGGLTSLAPLLGTAGPYGWAAGAGLGLLGGMFGGR